MFYLKEFFSTIWDIKGRGLLFVFSTLLLATLCVFRPSVQQGLIALAPDAWARPYFTALFDQTITEQDVLAEIRQRPEVAEVQTLNSAETGGILGRLLGQIGSEYEGKAQEIAAFGLRVILKNAQAIKQGEELVLGLEKSYGAEHVTTSGVRTPRVGGLFHTHPVFKYLSHFGYAGILAPVALLWALAFALCFSHFSRRAWIVERFQRRRFVRAKTTAMGIAVLAVVAILLSVALQGPDLLGLALCVACFSIPWAATMREVKWSSQN